MILNTNTSCAIHQEVASLTTSMGTKCQVFTWSEPLSVCLVDFMVNILQCGEDRCQVGLCRSAGCVSGCTWSLACMVGAGGPHLRPSSHLDTKKV